MEQTRPPAPQTKASAFLTCTGAEREYGGDRHRWSLAAQAGEIPSIRLGKRRMIPRAAIERLLAGERLT